MLKCYHPEGVCEKCPHPELCPDEKNTLHKETLHKVEQFSCPFFGITCKTPMCDICVRIKKNNEEVGFSAH